MKKNGKHILLYTIGLIFLIQLLLAIFRAELYPFSRYPMYAELNMATDFTKISICLSKNKLMPTFDSKEPCLPIPIAFNFYQSRVMRDWLYKKELQYNFALRKKTIRRHQRFLKRALRNSKLDTPIHITVYKENWDKINEENWTTPTNREIIFQYVKN